MVKNIIHQKLKNEYEEIGKLGTATVCQPQER